MTECTVYTPCGRYVVHFAADATQQQLWIDVHSNTLHPSSGPSSAGGHDAAMLPATAERSSSGTTVSPSGTEAGSTPTAGTATTSAPPLSLSASLTEGDVLALTTSAGVRKSFANFSTMLYDALIGRSACVHFYVETVAEMKERIQRDVQQQQQHQQRQHGSPSAGLPLTRAYRGGVVDTTAAGALAALEVGSATHASPHPSPSPTTLAKAGTTDASGLASSQVDGASAPHDRVRAAVGDTVIELDEDIASEVLEQRFLTVDYDVDFTRAIFPIPLTETTDSSERYQALTAGARGAQQRPSGAAPTETERLLRQDLRSALARADSLEREVAKLRKENAALVQLSKQKMLEMQRLCDDFQQRVHGAAEAEKLRAKNAELRVRLQEAVEERQAALRTLERERSQRRLLGAPAPSTPSSSRRGPSLNRMEGGAQPRREGGSSRSSSSGNPYRRSLSQDSASAPERRGGSSRLPYARRTSLAGSDGRSGCGAQRPLMSPAPTPTSRLGPAQRTSSSAAASSTSHRRASTRFDTPPGPSPAVAAGSAALRVRRSRSRGGASEGGGGGGDSPAPRDRTGGRHAAVLKPRRSASGTGHKLSSRDSSPSMPRRGPSLWAETSDRASSRGSVASSSRCSSASHERLYRAATVSSRQRQTPKSYELEALGARRAVFH